MVYDQRDGGKKANNGAEWASALKKAKVLGGPRAKE
jgi:hypothetical protein